MICVDIPVPSTLDTIYKMPLHILTLDKGSKREVSCTMLPGVRVSRDSHVPLQIPRDGPLDVATGFPLRIECSGHCDCQPCPP